MSVGVAVVAIDASPTAGGRTRAALKAVTAAATEAGAAVETILLAAAGTERAVAALADADAVVLASPVYRASFATPLKELLDAIPREGLASPDSRLSGKATAMVLTGASLHHFLALDGLRSVLAGFFAAHVVPPGLYVPREAFADDLVLKEPHAGQASAQGGALVDLARAVCASTALRSLRPQA
jgi:FMN reductase